MFDARDNPTATDACSECGGAIILPRNRNGKGSEGAWLHLIIPASIHIARPSKP